MAAIPITIIGQISTPNGGIEQATITGIAAITGLEVGGGPVTPPLTPAHPIAGPPEWGHHPAHPIAGPPEWGHTPAHPIVIPPTPPEVDPPVPAHPIVLPPVPPEVPVSPPGGAVPEGWGWHWHEPGSEWLLVYNPTSEQAQPKRG